MDVKSKLHICLGIESTAHTFGVAIVSSDGRILSNVNDKYSPPPGKGIHPREATQHHCEVGPKVLGECLHQWGGSTDQIDVIAFSKGPGLGPALRTGATMARTLAYWLEKPLVPIHHAIAHIEIAAQMTGASDPLVVLVSGGHTTVTGFAGGRWRIFGETEDITLGNLLDMFGREVPLQTPGGPELEKLASRGRNFTDLPYVVKGNDVSYSGLLTAAKRLLHQNIALEDLCYSLQEVAFAMLAEATERALAHTQKREVLLTGGVAANKRLTEMLKIVTEDHGARFLVVPREYSGDSGAQIAWTGILAASVGVKVDVSKSFVKPRWRLDTVDIPWR
ncbi:N(6)-L-threonylcarbamoyladenine synthase Kae1 [Candidatus Bathyarchaeota archaeon]|nr:N(6)-L-threonylcarbamoyladenine synthase Kae1 [Candidatus Bathyarchaeota archaeon]